MRAIRELIPQLPVSFGAPNFGETFYQDSQGKEQPFYELTRDGFTLLAMGFTGRKALQWKCRYIEAFNKMEAALIKRGAIPLTRAEVEQIIEEKLARKRALPFLPRRQELFRSRAHRSWR